MNRFLLIAREKESDYDKLEGEDRKQFMAKFQAWAKNLDAKGQFLGADELPKTFKRVERNTKGDHVLDGPFPETKEVLTGYFLIRAKDMPEAVNIAKECPVLRFDHLEVYDLGGEE